MEDRTGNILQSLQIKIFYRLNFKFAIPSNVLFLSIFFQLRRTDIQQNIQDRYGNRYDPRFHSIPGEYDPEDDPRFSDPRYQDPRNLPKYQNNRHRVPQDRYDSKYRYYER